MTFIVGINLSDRLLLASDTKITKKSGDRREIVGYCIKLQQFVDGEFIKENIARLNHIACMFAGNKEFIRFLSAKLSIAFEKKQLPIDINDLIKNIEKYLREIVPKYEGKNKRCRMIFAGTSSDPNVLKTFEFDRLSYLIGPQAGKIEDPNLVEAINIGELDGRGVIFVPDQKIFSFDIDENRSIFELSEVGKTYSIIDGGAHNLTEERKNELLKYFLNKRDIEKEASDIITLIRNVYSDSIGGAVTIGYIDKRGRLIYISYNINRSGKRHESNWSFTIDENGNFLGIDPDGGKVDLGKGFFKKDGSCELEI